MIQVLIAPVTPFQQNCSLVWCSETMEGTAANNFQERGYIFSMYNDSNVVRTRFVPFPF